MEIGEPTLREANAVRHIEWSNGDGDGTAFYAVELFGEAGEALNVVKKLVRESLGMVGSRATLNDLAEELADVVICVDLLAMAYRLPTVRPEVVLHDAPLTSAIALGRCVGEAMGWVLDLGEFDVECPQWPLDALTETLAGTLGFADELARAYEIDLRQAVVAKFNKTSAKYGLKTMMAEDASLI